MGKTAALIANLREAANIVRSGNDVYSDYFQSAEDFSNEIERLAAFIERYQCNPLTFILALIYRKLAKYTWCSPTYDLDDYLAGHPRGLELCNAIYEAL